MIRSARAMASEIAYSEAGEFLPSHCDNFRAAGMQAAIMRITRFLPSSVTTSVAYSSFVRYKRICPDISNFGICTASFVRIGAKLNSLPTSRHTALYFTGFARFRVGLGSAKMNRICPCARRHYRTVNRLGLQLYDLVLVTDRSKRCR